MNQNIFRVYDPKECDKDGVPFDFLKCRACDGTGRLIHEIKGAHSDTFVANSPCPTCRCHGSLRSAALAELLLGELKGMGKMVGGQLPILFRGADRNARCDECNHPKSAGIWQGISEYEGFGGWNDEQRLAVALEELTRGWEPDKVSARIHYSPCDSECYHTGPVRVERRTGGWLQPAGNKAILNAIKSGRCVEASWRTVYARTLGWPHDLRIEKLAVLCLRCYAVIQDREQLRVKN